MKFLVVDDSATMVRIIANTLQRIGIKKENILTAKDGLEALELYKQYKNEIGVLLTDWNMPNMDGLELVKTIRKIESEEGKNKESGIKIVMITTEGGKKEVITALKSGVNNYIVKPFTPQVLRQKLEQIGIKA